MTPDSLSVFPSDVTMSTTETLEDVGSASTFPFFDLSTPFCHRELPELLYLFPHTSTQLESGSTAAWRLLAL
jgi:hypothetical protein